MRILAAVVAVMMCCVGPAAAGQAEHAFQDRLLAEALRTLQKSGLPIVFSSEIVTAEMRVVEEPRATTPRRQLDELLAPHGLKAERGPGSVIQIVRVKPAGVPDSKRKPAETTTTSRREVVGKKVTTSEHAGGAYTDQVTVTASRRERVDRGVASEMTLDANALQSVSSVLQDDPLQALHSLPRVAAVDDFRSEFSVRGSPYRHVGMVIDGVATPWLKHTMYDRSDAGSLSMFGSDSLERATLQAGAYPQRYDDRLGAQLDITLREGSREFNRFYGSFGGTSAAFLAEGPFGAERRGSWIVSARNSYRSWPVSRQTPNGVGFAFADAHAKLVYDFTPTQQFTFTALGGRSTLDTVDEPLPSALATGTNRAGLLSVSWRASLGPGTVIRQRASAVDQNFANTWPTGQTAGGSSNRAFAYRSEIFHTLLGGTFEAGGEVRQLQGVRHVARDGPASVPDAFGAAWSTRSAYAHLARTVGRRMSFAGGLRVSDSTLVHDRALAPWILGDWSFKPGWTLNASAGVSHQFPELDPVRAVSGSSDLKPERATHIDVGVGQHLANAFRWQATVFTRAERDVLRAPDVYPRLADGVVFGPPTSGRYQNALHGTSRGVELLVARHGAGRLFGWVSYVYGTMRQTDTISHETFWADFDQRHAFNVVGVYRLSDQASLGIVFRGASNVPVPGHLTARDGGLYIGERRNDIRLSHYARLDARAQRAFTSSRGQITVFAEVVNVLNRQNLGPAHGLIQTSTGEATGFSRTLLPRRVSVGIEIGFGRDGVREPK